MRGEEYYVAGRTVPAFFNGMATGSDWMSAASFVGLAGILVCSMLGGMKAVTWTQVAQYIILIVAYLTPVTVMSYKTTGVPISEVMYGQILQKIDAKEKAINADPKETEVRELWKKEVAKIDADIKGLPASLDQKKNDLETKLAALPADAPAKDREAVEKAIKGLPKNSEEAKEKWTAAKTAAAGKTKPIKPYLEPFARLDMKNMLALTFCLMVGTAGLPHILMRYYTVPSVKDARISVGWSLFFIFLLYFTAPAYAAFARNEVLHNLVGIPIAQLPAWVANWRRQS